MRKISIFGSTGSIGCNTIDLIQRNLGSFHVAALTGGKNISKLAEQARSLNAEIAVTADEKLLDDLRQALAGTDIECAAGEAAILEAAARPADWIMSAIVGAAGLEPSLVAAGQGSTLALANKESLVMAGPLLKQTAAESGCRILPVDSEHSAVFQALVGEDIDAVERVIITASGGAFRNWSIERMATATPEQALTHPNWSMGQRITVDSASMFNKAMELIETKEFFGFEPAQIDAVIHPQSLVHAMVGFRDGAMMSHLGAHDMRHAIGYALNWPVRLDLPVHRLDLTEVGRLDFSKPDEEKYPALRLARDVMETGGLTGTVFNAAKEAALDGFLARSIGFLDMAVLVERAIEKLTGEGLGNAPITLENVRNADARARDCVAQMIDG